MKNCGICFYAGGRLAHPWLMCRKHKQAVNINESCCDWCWNNPVCDSTKLKAWNEEYKVHVEVIGHEQQEDGFVIKFASVAFNKATAEMTRREFTRKILISEVLPEGHEFEGR